MDYDAVVVGVYEETVETVPPKVHALQMGSVLKRSAAPPQNTGSDAGNKRHKNCRKREAGASQGCSSLDKKAAAYSAIMHLENLKSARGSFTGAAMDYRMACTATKDNTCQIVRHLPLWNEFLCKAHLELQVTPVEHGRLSLSACHGVREYHASRDEFQQAAALVYWLLKTHRCVAVVDIRASSWNAHPALFADALRDNPFVKSLTFSVSSLEFHRGLSEVVPTLTHLRQFECIVDARFQVELTTGLPLLLQRAKSLTSLKIPKLLWEDRKAAHDFLQALMMNSTLNELAVHDSLFLKLNSKDGVIHAMSTISPLTLTLEVSRRPSRNCLFACLLGLSRNRSISNLRLANVRLDERVGASVATIWKENRFLRTFSLVSTRWDFHEDEYPQEGCTSEILTSDTLEEVTLPLHIWGEERWELFFAVLAKKATLRKVTIEMFVIDGTFMRKIAKAIRESKVEEKVFFMDMRTEHATVKLEGSCLSKLYIEPACEGPSSRLSRIMRRLPLCEQVTSMDLQADLFCLDYSEIEVFGEYISSTTALRKLSLGAPYRRLWEQFGTSADRFWTVVAQSLQQNTSIRDLCIEPENVSEAVVTQLVDVIRASQKISKLHFTAHKDGAAKAFIAGLSSAIAENYRLVKVTMKDVTRKDLDEAWFSIQNAVGRNYRMVTQAAQYLTGGVFDRYCAEALERISSCPILVEEAAFLASVSVAEAEAEIRDRLRYLDDVHYFMRLAGVVEEQVTCHSLDHGGTQIDRLNEDCWARVRCYLKLEDIREPLVPLKSLQACQMFGDHQYHMDC